MMMEPVWRGRHVDSSPTRDVGDRQKGNWRNIQLNLWPQRHWSLVVGCLAGIGLGLGLGLGRLNTFCGAEAGAAAAAGAAAVA